jgi:predicted TIM-barrel fold metal-dependent hydrolase
MANILTDQRVIDTHQHLWDPIRFRYAWLTSVPSLNRAFSVSDYSAITRDIQVAKSVFVEADVNEAFILEEARYALTLAAAPQTVVAGVVASGRPEKKDFRPYLDKICGNSKLKGIRRVLHTEPDEVSKTELFVHNIRSLESYRLSFDLCVLARQLPIAINLVSRCPGVTFILDHCGLPDLKREEFKAWCNYIVEISRFPNVCCKLSGLMTCGNPGEWEEKDLQPYIDQVIACFGWDRVLFGSDWPICTLGGGFQRWLSILYARTHTAGGADQGKLFHGNAVRVYRLNED